MKAGVNVWTWGTQSKAQFEQALREVSDIGYQAVENTSGIAGLYGDAPEEFDALLARYRLEFACGYVHLTGDTAADDARVKECLAFLKQHRAPCMNIQAQARPEGGPTRADLEHITAEVAKISRWAREAGVTPCLHPHFATAIEQAPELDYLMENVEPALLALGPDTAHLVLGGMDPVATIRKYAKRVGYVHVKDIGGLRDPGVPYWDLFVELGRGTIDFPAIHRVLAEAGFEGVLCVETDRPRVCGYKSALISRQYMREELGV